MEPVIIIQRAFRKWFYRNSVCCITLEKLKYPCFMYKSFGVNIFYDYLALNRYFKVSGKYTDPKTRKKYTNQDIERFYKELSLHFPNEKPNNINHLVRESLNYLNTPYVYSFSLVPEEHQPSGSVNLSRVDTPYLSRSEEYQPSGTLNQSRIDNFNFVTSDPPLYQPSGTINNLLEIRMNTQNEPELTLRSQINIPLFDPTRTF